MFEHAKRQKEKGNGFGIDIRQPQNKSCSLTVGGKGVNDLINERQRRNHKSVNEKTNAFLATSYKGSQANGMTLVNGVRQLNQSKESAGKQPYQQNRVYDTHHKSPAHCASLTGGSYKIADEQQREGRIRRLTPTECARLQTIPEWYKWKCSNTQQYKMLGNGWTVEVIKHIFSFMNHSDVPK